MIVMEYTSRFNNLGTYVPTIISDETLKMHRFKKGLSSRIQSALAVFKPNNFADLMGAAMSVETDIKHREEENRNKRPLVSQYAQNGPKFKKSNHSSGPPRGNFNSAGNTKGKWCDTCRQMHIGECYRKIGACFKCGKVGHRINDCPDNKEKGTGPNKPNENKTNARVYAITQEEADNTNEVVAGTILLNEMPAYTLFDCGATHSFVSRRFSKKLKLEHDIFSEPLRVATPASKIIETHKVYRNCCQKKDIRLQTPTKEEVIYHGKTKKRKSLLSASQAWKVIKGREEIYLAVINEIKEEEVPKLEDIPIVKEFPDVFPEELPGEIPDREVEFEINLVPEYSPNKDAAFCFPCLFFQGKETCYPTFTVNGFRSWKRVNDGKRCALLMHVGGATSPHNNAVQSMGVFINASCHIDKVMNAQTAEEFKKNRLRLKATIESIC
ncbi:uncharacterized protein LOC142541978 [Primulina tabacum]|uniref:uncharacterized protein LOC142541978 n=1 Tax=Primulina tabacum TaxID=48773 RepID=UPI003F591DC1